MTVDDLVAEGDSFRVAHPTASVGRLRAHLLDLAAPNRRGPWGGGSPVGCLAAILTTLPRLLFAWTVGRSLRRAHADRVERALAILTARPAPGRKRRPPDRVDGTDD